jgi:hypothetical protein
MSIHSSNVRHMKDVTSLTTVYAKTSLTTCSGNAFLLLAACVAAWAVSFSVAAAPGDLTDHGEPHTACGSVTALVYATDGKLFGVTFDNHLFVFNPLDSSFSDKGATPGDNPLALTWGPDGKLYGGGWGSTLWSYNLGTDSFAARGQVPGGRRIIALTTGLDGLIYVGTEPEDEPDLKGRLFSFNPTTDAFGDTGGVADEGSVGYALVTAPDGKIYGGTYRHGHFFVYDPSTGVLTDKGQPIAGQSAVGALAIGGDGKIYGGVQSSGHIFAYDPDSGSFSDEGQAVADQPRVTSLSAFGYRLYGGTGNFGGSTLSAHVFEYDIYNGRFTDAGVPVEGERNIGSLVVSGGMVYGGTSFVGHFFSYEPMSPIPFRVGAAGNVFAGESFYAAEFQSGSADVAEWVAVSESVEPGDVLELDPCKPGTYRLSAGPCSSLVAGVVSTQPGVVLGERPASGECALLALTGIVPVKVTDEGGPIQPGNLLVSSSTPGHAMRWAGPGLCPCSLVGKALEPMTDEVGVILVLLTAN